MPTSNPSCLRSFVERAGLLCERDGLPRIAGRMLGLLLVAPEALALDQIADRLGVSKASVSTDARRLEERGLLERVGRPGDRKDYYQIAPEYHVRSLEQRLADLREFLALLDAAQQLPVEDPDVRARLTASCALYREVMDATRAALDRWRAGSAARASSAG